MKSKKWIFPPLDLKASEILSNELGISTVLSKVLVARGLDTKDKARAVFGLKLTDLCDPFLMKDMARACEIIKSSIETGEKIVVYGDYDVDGITSVSVLTDYLKYIGANVSYYIPNRLTDGYGLSTDSLSALINDGAKLIITVDCGITASEEVDFVLKQGCKIIITDHHECKDTVPLANAVVNPKQADCPYPFKELAGVGVAFKLVCALSSDVQFALNRYSDLVATGTVADVMPLIFENRIIVSHGLRKFAKTDNIGLKNLLQKSGFDSKKITSSTISFVLAPRINAAGRLGNASMAAELFLTENTIRASKIADILCEQNRARQSAENEILVQALDKLKKQFDDEKIIVLAGENWHNGVVGIVSSKIVDKYNLPTLLVSFDGDKGKGSGRSLKGFNLFEALSQNSQFLDKFGGHELAAGITVSRENFDTFKANIESYAAKVLDDEAIKPSITIDAALDLHEISLETANELLKIEPFGMANPQPIFCFSNAKVESVTPISSDKHVKALLSKDGYEFTAMLFGSGEISCGFAPGDIIDVAFNLDVNEFRGKRSVQLLIKDVKLSESERKSDEILLNAYNKYINELPMDSCFVEDLYPSRNDLVAVWRHLISRADNKKLSVVAGALARRISWESKLNVNVGKLFVCLDVFSESRLLSYHFKGDTLNIILKDFEGKADITGSVVLATLKNMKKV